MTTPIEMDNWSIEGLIAQRDALLDALRSASTALQANHLAAEAAVSLTLIRRIEAFPD